MPAGNIYSTGTLDTGDLIRAFDTGLQAGNERLWSDDISVDVQSNREVEEYGWLGQVPVMRQWVGHRIEKVLNKYSHTIRNHPYEVTLPISVEDLRRDRSGVLRQRVQDLGTRTRTHWNSLIGVAVTNGEAGTSGLTYDGNFLYDTDHNESGTNQTNDLTATEIPSANVATTSTLTQLEAANIIGEVVAYMRGLTDDQGEPVNSGVTDVLILVTKWGHYNGLLQAVGLSNLGTGTGNNNPLEAQPNLRIRVEYVTPRVTAADKLYFFFGNPTLSAAAFIRQTEVAPMVQVIGAGSEEEFKNNRHIFGVKAVRGIGYGAWQKTALVTLS